MITPHPRPLSFADGAQARGDGLGDGGDGRGDGERLAGETSRVRDPRNGDSNGYRKGIPWARRAS